MSDTVNPYQSPEADIIPAGKSQGGLTEPMLAYLRQASPWLRFVGILAYIGCGFLVLAAVLVLLVPSFQDWGSFSIGALAGLVYLGPAALLFFPARFTYGFGAKIRQYLRSGADGDLEQALKNNKSLWKFYGIMAIVYLAIVPVVIVIVVAVALGSSLLQ